MTTTLDKRLTPARPDLADERLRGLVESARYVTGRAQRLLAPSAPMRRAPRADAPLDTEALRGEPVTVYDESGGWAWAQLGRDGYVGYLPVAALGPDGPDPTHRVSALRTFVYPGPDLKLPPLAHLSLGSAVTPTDETGEFVRLDEAGWVFARHLSSADARVSDFVTTAERFLGTPYLWGGKTSLGLDCSALVQLAFATAGVAAPRDSDLQLAVGEPAPGARCRGDLVFWRGHVGIMLDAERLLHANAHHMAVAIEPLAGAVARIERNGGGPVTAVRRLG